MSMLNAQIRQPFQEIAHHLHHALLQYVLLRHKDVVMKVQALALVEI